MPIHEKFKLIRKELKLSQAEMAAKLGIKQSYYSEIERGEKEASDNVLNMFFDQLNVNKIWFEEDKGQPFTNVKTIDKKFSKIGTLRKQDFEYDLMPVDRQVITALNELPELVEKVNQILSLINIEDVDYLSSIGAAWIPGGVKLNVPKEFDKDFYNEAYEMNMIQFLKYLIGSKEAIIKFKSDIIEFLKEVQGLDKTNKIKLPAKYLQHKDKPNITII